VVLSYRRVLIEGQYKATTVGAISIDKRWLYVCKFVSSLRSTVAVGGRANHTLPAVFTPFSVTVLGTNLVALGIVVVDAD